MKFLINTTNLTHGGGVQVGVSFLTELKDIEDTHFYYLLLSPQIASQLQLINFEVTRFKIEVVHLKKEFLHQFANCKKLLGYEKLFKPDVIFTVFGPVIWRSRAKHVVGFARGHVIYPESPFFASLSIVQKLLIRIRIKLRIYFLIKNSEIFITETRDASERMAKKLKIDQKRVFTVSNTVNKVYIDYISKYDVSKKYFEEEFKLFTLSAFYPHKNLDIIKKVIPFLERSNQKVKFYITIDKENYERMFKGYQNWIVNLGPVKVADCPKLYESMDAMILPTLLECFTASYPEAMCMQRPILTSDLTFARSICKDAALYFDPLDPKSIAEAIISLKNDKKLYQNLVEKGNKIFAMTPSPKDRALAYLQIITQ